MIRMAMTIDDAAMLIGLENREVPPYCHFNVCFSFEHLEHLIREHDINMSKEDFMDCLAMEVEHERADDSQKIPEMISVCGSPGAFLTEVVNNYLGQLSNGLVADADIMKALLFRGVGGMFFAQDFKNAPTGFEPSTVMCIKNPENGIEVHVVYSLEQAVERVIQYTVAVPGSLEYYAQQVSSSELPASSEMDPVIIGRNNDEDVAIFLTQALMLRDA